MPQPISISEIIQRLIQEQNYSTLHWPYPEINNKIGLIRKGQMSVIAGRPSEGKTTLLINIMHLLHLKTLFISIEMNAEDIFQKLHTLITQVSSFNLTPKQQIVEHPIGTGDDLPFKIVDRGIIRVSDIEEILVESSTDPFEIIMIDYLQKISPEKNSKGFSLNQELTKISSDLKSLALEYKIPIFVASQLNRNIEFRNNRNPMLSDLRDSGSIEQDADLVMFLEPSTSNNGSLSPFNLNIIKNRYGPPGIISLLIDKKTNAIKNNKQLKRT